MEASMVPTWSRLKSAASSRGSLLALAASTAGMTFAAALPVAAAQAASCPETTLVQPFKAIEEKEKIKEPGYYSLVSGGAFEAGETAWTLSGGAKVASGGGISALTGKEAKRSLELPKGAVAVSPLTCVEPNDRTFRFLDHGEGGSTTLTVSVVYEGLTGLLATKVLSLTAATGKELTASAILHTGAHTAAKLSGGFAYMSIRF